LPYLEFHVADHCNLNCAGCSHYAPLAKPYYKTIDQFIKEIDRLAELMDPNKYFNLRLLGGEPLLHPDLLELCKIAREKLPTAEIGITTNSRLFKTKDNTFFEILNKYKISVYANNYPKTDFYNDQEIINNIKKCNLAIIHEHGGFVHTDLNFQDRKTEEDIKNRYLYCSNNLTFACLLLRDEYLYRCPVEAYSDFLFDYFKLNKPPNYNIEDNRINFYTTNVDEIVEFLNRPSTFCKYCN